MEMLYLNDLVSWKEHVGNSYVEALPKKWEREN